MSNLPDNYFRRFTPAELIAAIAASQPTLAQLSLENAGELERIGWTNNPIVDILYSLTSAGVWIARVDASGKQLISDTTQQTYQVMQLSQGGQPTITYPYPATQNGITAAKRCIRKVIFTSAADGSIATDPELVAAVASFYGVGRIISIQALAASGAAPVFEIQEGATEICKIATAQFEANKPLNANFGDQYFYIGTDNTAISLDGSGCSSLGNAVTYHMWIEYWYET